MRSPYNHKPEPTMKCFTVTAAEVKEGMAVQALPFAHVSIGASGQGRTLNQVGVEMVPTPQEVVRASVKRVNFRIQIVPEVRGDESRALVLVQIPAGFRGRTTWSGLPNPLQQKPCPHRGKVVAPKAGKCPAGCGETFQSLVHSVSGLIWEFPEFPQPGVRVIAEGKCAQGDAGLVGSHVERLLIMEPGSGFRVVRDGRLYGSPSERIVWFSGGQLRLGSMEDLLRTKSDDDDPGELL